MLSGIGVSHPCLLSSDFQRLPHNVSRRPCNLVLLDCRRKNRSHALPCTLSAPPVTSSRSALLFPACVCSVLRCISHTWLSQVRLVFSHTLCRSQPPAFRNMSFCSRSRATRETLHCSFPSIPLVVWPFLPCIRCTLSRLPTVFFFRISGIFLVPLLLYAAFLLRR